jgi:acetyltransferase-like isoleucine patch superfamily enzyme
MYKMIKTFFHLKIKNWIKSYIDTYLGQLFSQGYFDRHIKDVILKQYIIFGDAQRLKLSETSIVNNALFNLSCGNILIGEHVFFGHNVSLITGTHNYNKFGVERMTYDPNEGNDIVVEEGVWIASNVTVIGPCQIGKHSVIAAGAVVKGDVPSYHLVAGIPAKIVKKIIPPK